MIEVNQKTLAEALGITTRQVRHLKEQGMFEVNPVNKKYNLTKCVSEYIDFKIKAETRTGTALDKEKEQAEHEKLKIEITKIKLRKLRNEIHEAADVEMFLNNMLTAFRNRLTALPSKVGPLIISEPDVNVIIKKLADEVAETLEELSEYDPAKINSENSLGLLEDEDEGED